MGKIGRSKSWAATTGVVLFVALLALPALSSAAPLVPSSSVAAVSGGIPWAYGGMGWANRTVTIGNATVTWNASFGWDVIFRETPTGPNTTMIEANRTVGITITATFTSPQASARYSYHAQELDAAFANLTNASAVYVNNRTVPALGIVNTTVFFRGLTDQSFQLTRDGSTESESLTASGQGHANVAFAPALGLMPRSLTGVGLWNSTAVANVSAGWNFTWDWSSQGIGGPSGAGQSSKEGSLRGSGPVYLSGVRLGLYSRFSDHLERTGILLVVRGPFDLYDGFFFVPHDFDLFGGAALGFDAYALGTSEISAQSLYVSSGPYGAEVGAATTTFGSVTGAFDTNTAALGSALPAATYNPGSTVLAQPMSVAQAQAESNSLAPGSGGNSPGGGNIGLLGVVAVAAVGAGILVLGAVAWRGAARRRTDGARAPVHAFTGTSGSTPAPGAPSSESAPTPTKGAVGAEGERTRPL